MPSSIAQIIKRITGLVLISVAGLVTADENTDSQNIDADIAEQSFSLSASERRPHSQQNEHAQHTNTLGNLIKNYHLGKSVLIEKPDRGSDVSLVEITISLSMQRNSPYICAVGQDYVVICRALKGGIISDIYSTNNIIIHDNKFCENNKLCFTQENK